MTGGRDDDGFLSRWSRRKRAVADEEAEIADRAVPAQPEEPAEESATEPRTDEEILADLGLKHPDEMQAGDDFSVFLKAAVPEHLKRLALRKLWRSNPILANLDGLNDYDTDFTGDTVAPGMLKTVYKVGRGLVPEPAEPEPAEDMSSEAGHENFPEETTEEVAAESDDLAANSGEIGKERTVSQENDTTVARKRMKFRFET